MRKLYEIVLVRHPDYHHFGQVLSRLTPSRTYMVRMVPDHPNTLREIPEDRLMGTTGRVKFVHYAAVAGHGTFPIDMLRYDHAAPLNFDPETCQIDPSFGFKELVIARATDMAIPRWTHERWRSFLWSVRDIKTEAIKGE